MSNDSKGRQTLLRLVWALMLFLSFCGWGQVSGVKDQVKNNSPARQENRFLLIVETSRAAGKCKDGIAATVQNLIASGIQGQAARDDTLGIWTYNDALNAGEFPLQTWSDRAARHIASGVMAYLATQKYAHNAHFKSVLPTLEPIIANSAYITVIVVCSGTDAIQGTPFDTQIQKSMRTWRDEQQKAGMPLVVVLSAAHGKFTDFKVSPAQWQIEMPPLAAELVQARQSRPKVAGTAAAGSKPAIVQPAPTAAPLIVSGKHRDTQSNATTAALSPSVPEARLETNLSVQPKPVAASAAIVPANATGSDDLHVVPLLQSNKDAVEVVPTRIAKASTTALVTHSNSETAAAVHGNQESIASAASAAPVHSIVPAPAIALPSAGTTSVLLKRLVLLGVVLFAVGGLFLVRRSQQAHVSLITHSIDRERE